MYHRDLIRWGLEETARDMAQALDGLTAEERRHQPTPEANHIDFIVWHLTRVEDMWIQQFAQGKPSIWEADGWAEKAGFHHDKLGYGMDIGFGYTIEQVRDLPAYDHDVMDQYVSAVRQSTLAYLDAATVEELSAPREVPVPQWNPFSVGFSLSRILVEQNQHIGHIAYIRGMQRGINK